MTNTRLALDKSKAIIQASTECQLPVLDYYPVPNKLLLGLVRRLSDLGPVWVLDLLEVFLILVVGDIQRFHLYF